MATPRGQRIGIWIIAIVLTVGTLGSFLVMGLSVNNQKIDETIAQKQYDDYLASQKASLEGINGYSSVAFDKDVTELKVEILKQGDGAVVAATDSINASYFGWLSDGTIFDSSKNKDVDDAPITFSLGGVIEGWTEGLTGQKVGSTVKLTIPAAKAYGAQANASIPANSPLAFIVEIKAIDNSVSQEE